MKIDEDLGLDREDAFQTDDEENQAERAYDSEDDTHPEIPPMIVSQCSIKEQKNLSTCRESMDMLKGVKPPSISFLKGASATGLIGSSSFYKDRSNDDESSLGKSLISEIILDEEAPTSTLPASQQRISVNVSIQPQKQC
ncbi:hypothetical protein DITRI_Ditri06bG0076600 [Diplodiscus trichospermus]